MWGQSNPHENTWWTQNPDWALVLRSWPDTKLWTEIFKTERGAFLQALGTEYKKKKTLRAHSSMSWNLRSKWENRDRAMRYSTSSLSYQGLQVLSEAVEIWTLLFTVPKPSALLLAHTTCLHSMSLGSVMFSCLSSLIPTYSRWE